MLILVLSYGPQTQAPPAQSPWPPSIAYFLGTWRISTPSSNWVSSFTVESKAGKVYLTVDGRAEPIEATVYGDFQKKEAVAIIASIETRYFIVRRTATGVVLEMYSNFRDVRFPTVVSAPFQKK